MQGEKPMLKCYFRGADTTMFVRDNTLTVVQAWEPKKPPVTECGECRNSEARCIMADAVEASTRDTERIAALDSSANQEEWERGKADLYSAMTESRLAQHKRAEHVATHSPI